jgi:hypothetical protein
MPTFPNRSRFALIGALTRAQRAHPREFPHPSTLTSMNDDDLSGYATQLLDSLDRQSRTDPIEIQLHEELQTIISWAHVE